MQGTPVRIKNERLTDIKTPRKSSSFEVWRCLGNLQMHMILMKGIKLSFVHWDYHGDGEFVKLTQSWPTCKKRFNKELSISGWPLWMIGRAFHWAEVEWPTLIWAAWISLAGFSLDGQLLQILDTFTSHSEGLLPLMVRQMNCFSLCLILSGLFCLWWRFMSFLKMIRSFFHYFLLFPWHFPEENRLMNLLVKCN